MQRVQTPVFCCVLATVSQGVRVSSPHFVRRPILVRFSVLSSVVEWLSVLVSVLLCIISCPLHPDQCPITSCGAVPLFSSLLPSNPLYPVRQSFQLGSNIHSILPSMVLTVSHIPRFKVFPPNMHLRQEKSVQTSNRFIFKLAQRLVSV